MRLHPEMVIWNFKSVYIAATVWLSKPGSVRVGSARSLTPNPCAKPIGTNPRDFYYYYIYMCVILTIIPNSCVKTLIRH